VVFEAMMSQFARKLILHSPISDESLLADFFEQCLRDQVSLLAVVGPGCVHLEEAIDWIVVGDDSSPNASFAPAPTPTNPSTMY
jgi:hypothetical protein